MSNTNDEENEVGGSPHGGSAATDVSLSLDATFNMLAAADRRVILRILTEAPDHVTTIDELVAQLVRRQADETGEMPSPDNVEMQIHHVHLPKLAEVGLVEYDARNEELRYWPDDRLETWLQRALEDDSE